MENEQGTNATGKRIVSRKSRDTVQGTDDRGRGDRTTVDRGKCTEYKGHVTVDRNGKQRTCDSGQGTHRQGTEAKEQGTRDREQRNGDCE